MVHKIKILAAFLLSLIFMVYLSCDETTEFEKGQLFNPAVQGQLATDTLYAEIDTTYSIAIPNTRGSDRLLVGSFAGFHCRPILKFTTLPTGATISGAHIKFITADIAGDNPQPFTVKAFPIVNEWVSNTDITWDNYQENIDTTKTLGTLEVNISDNDTLIMEMDSLGLKYFNKWVKEDSIDFNYGFLLEYYNANFMKAFNSNRNTKGPQVILTYTFPEDTTHKDSAYSTSDAFLIESDFNKQANRNYVVSLAPWVTLLQFNTNSLLNKLPDGFIVESANLQLAIDRPNSLFDSGFGAYCNILKLTSDIDNNNVEIDTSVFGSSIYTIDIAKFSDDSSYVEVNIGSERRDFAQLFIQDRVDKPQPTKNLYVGFKSNIDFLSYIALLKHDNQDLSKRPRLILEYWIPPGVRF